MLPATQRFKRISILVLKVSITLILVYVIVTRTNVSGIVAAVSQFGYGLVAFLALLNIGAVCVSALKWRMLLPEVSLKDLTVACFVSYYFALLLPGQLAQEGAKAYYIDRRALPKRHRIASSIFIDKILSIIGLLVVGCVGVIFSQRPLPPALTVLFLTSTGAALLLLFSLRVGWIYQTGCRLLAYATGIFPKGRAIFGACRNVIESWHLYTRDLWMLFANAALAVVYQVIGILTFYLLAQSLHLGISFFDWSWIVAALSLAILLPLTIGGLGVREGTLIALLRLYNCGSETAVGISVTVFFLMLVLAGIGGALALFFSVTGRAEPT